MVYFESMKMTTACAIASGEFGVYYQPRFEARTLAPVSAEALVRWLPDPTLSPCAFIPKMERNGSIGDLTMFVLATVCQDIHQFRARMGCWPKVSVNISPALFRDPQSASQLADLVATYGVPPSVIEMEITEGFIQIDLETVVTAVRQLSAAGFEIALDDFGTGMSSLHYLDLMPASTIKIDRHFIIGAGARPTCARIVSSVVKLARESGLASVAEGVETAEQLKYVSALGCHEIQGFLLARPTPFDAYLTFTEFMLRRRLPSPRPEEGRPQPRILLPQGC